MTVPLVLRALLGHSRQTKFSSSEDRAESQASADKSTNAEAPDQAQQNNPAAAAPAAMPQAPSQMDPVQVFGEQLQIITRSVNILVDLFQQLNGGGIGAGAQAAPPPGAAPVPQAQASPIPPAQATAAPAMPIKTANSQEDIWGLWAEVRGKSASNNSDAFIRMLGNEKNPIIDRRGGF